MGFSGVTSSKESACQCRRHKRRRFDPWLGRSPRDRNGNPLQYSCLENPMGRGGWQATVHGAARVGHDWVTKPAAPPPTPAFLPGEFRRQRSLAGYSLWCHKELDMTEWLSLSFFTSLQGTGRTVKVKHDSRLPKPLNRCSDKFRYNVCLMKVKEESDKVGLKLNIQKTKIMASSPITSWQIDGETVETVADYFSGLPNHCRWWLQQWN